MATLFIVIPVLNEAGNVPRLMADLNALAPQVAGEFAARLVLVDDGSSDGTGDLARAHAGELPLDVLRHERPRGPGAAFATAFEHLAGRLQADDWVVTMEGDNTSRVETILQMLTRRKEGFDVVLASPYAYGGGIDNTPLLRVFMSHVANTMVKELMGIRGILTMSSFFRLTSAPMLQRLQARYGPRVLDTTGFECMVELLWKYIQERAAISEVAMALDTSRRVGRSKMKVVRTAVRYFLLYFRIRRWRREMGL